MVVTGTGGDRESPLCDRESFTHWERERVCVRKVDIRLSGKWEFKLPWRKAGLLKSSR